jgi:hypothetical protein
MGKTQGEQRTTESHNVDDPYHSPEASLDAHERWILPRRPFSRSVTMSRSTTTGFSYSVSVIHRFTTSSNI